MVITVMAVLVIVVVIDHYLFYFLLGERHAGDYIIVI